MSKSDSMLHTLSASKKSEERFKVLRPTISFAG